MYADHMYDLYSRHCANGSIQVKGVDYFSSYAAISTADSIRISIAFAASRKMLIFGVDIGNCFQSNLQEVEKRVYIKVPPLYLEWFRDRYPKHPIPPTKTIYVLQAVHSIQGTRSAGNEWYEFSSKLFKKMGMVKNATDAAVFTFRLEDDLLIVLTNVDDFLILASTNDI